MRQLAIGVSLLMLAGCGQGGARNDAAALTNDATTAAANAGDRIEDGAGAAAGMGSAMTANTPDAYASNAALGDLYELESSRLALTKAQSPQIKQFTQKMIDDHTATTAGLKAAIAEAKLDLTPPTRLDARRGAMLDNLRGLSGAAFDRAYLDQQTAAHQEALTLHRGFAEDGETVPLKQFAATTAPKIEMHLEMVRKLDEQGADGTQ